MTDEEKLAIAIKSVEIYFNENVSVEKAIEIAKRTKRKGEDYEFKVDKRTIS